MEKTHILSITVENESGVLTRVAGLFSARGFNIDSICVAKTLEKNESKMIIATSGDAQILEQIVKQLNRLINVIKVQEFTDDDSVLRQTVLVKVNADETTKGDIFRIKEIFNGRIIDVSRNHYTLEVTGSEKKIDSLIDILRPLGIKDIVKTGIIALASAKKII
ncbi:MAG: acetolactate synthase small subunit [Deltaproteobacteria bacterium]|jgi:acetolactate synthase-1/3 small subunit|nr:acetolactate synthase small subunit [Deltaproteobacteria bacterium]MCL6120614.1 acetolactate synthase small subunit [Deltaproteobacteria bacterium]MDA8299793.1 acetolactate synthase small subunit [Deltaproteobacteria bacterium]